MVGVQLRRGCDRDCTVRKGHSGGPQGGALSDINPKNKASSCFTNRNEFIWE